MSKITRSTIKSFIRKNKKIYISVKREFDGMTDGSREVNSGFKLVERVDASDEHTLGLKGA